jgi:cadmium resistance protein CadD (predicted permease)
MIPSILFSSLLYSLASAPTDEPAPVNDGSSGIGYTMVIAVVTFFITNIEEAMILLLFFAQCKPSSSTENKKVETVHHVTYGSISQEDSDVEEPSSSNNKGKEDEEEASNEVDESEHDHHVLSSPGMRSFHVVCGHMIGFGALVVISLFGLVLGLFISLQYLGFIGLLPLGIGIWAMYKQIRKLCRRRRASKQKEKSKQQQEPQEEKEFKGNGDKKNSYPNSEEKAVTIGAEDAATIVEDEVESDSDSDDDIRERTHQHQQGRCSKWCPSWLCSHHIITVAVITMGSGGDEIGVYLPLFAGLSAHPFHVVVTVIIFMSMSLLWCGLCYYLVRCRSVAKAMDRYGDYIVPPFLVALGIYVMYENNTFELFKPLIDKLK